MGACAIASPSLSNTPLSFGVSEFAIFARARYRSSIHELRKTVTLGMGITDSIMELAQVYSECKMKGWDGYAACAVSESTFEFATLFLDELPLGTLAPSIGAEPDGHLTLEWHRSTYWTLSISISPEGELNFAALLGASKQYGTELFFRGEIPRQILDLIFRVTTT